MHVLWRFIVQPGFVEMEYFICFAVAFGVGGNISPWNTSADTDMSYMPYEA